MFGVKYVRFKLVEFECSPVPEGKMFVAVGLFIAVLTAIGLGSTFYRPGWRVLLYAFLGTVFTVVAQGALNVALAPLGIPTLTFPFVIAAWLFLLPHVHFAQKGSDVSPSD